MCFKVGISHQSLPYGFPNEIFTVAVKMGVPKLIGRDIPNFIKDVPNFVKDVLKVPKCVSRWGSTMNHFLMGCQMKLWPQGNRMMVLKAI